MRLSHFMWVYMCGFFFLFVVQCVFIASAISSRHIEWLCSFVFVCFFVRAKVSCKVIDLEKWQNKIAAPEALQCIWLFNKVATHKSKTTIQQIHLGHVIIYGHLSTVKSYVHPSIWSCIFPSVAQVYFLQNCYHIQRSTNFRNVQIGAQIPAITGVLLKLNMIVMRCFFSFSSSKPTYYKPNWWQQYNPVYMYQNLCNEKKTQKQKKFPHSSLM